MTGLPINFSRPAAHSGFSLVELTIVLLIVALLSGGLMLSLSSQQEQAQSKELQHQWELQSEALLGFAMANGRLPCPADPTVATTAGAGSEAITCNPVDCSGDRTCTFEHGVLPWLTLGIKETDPWGNRFTYFVGREFANPLSATEINNGLRARFKLDTAGRANIQDGASNNTVRDLPAVVVSHGNRAAGAYQSSGGQIAGAVGDEAENADADLTFISHTPNASFDDFVGWIIPSVLKSRMVTVGKLP